jgi:choline monooxygenase
MAIAGAELAAILEQFDAERPLELATALPAAWYTSPHVAERELGTVFQHNWQALVGGAMLSGGGEFMTGELGKLPVVASRDEKGGLHAFANVCRHRAAVVACGEGRADRFSCPYHGWQYGLDGRLLSAPELGAVCEFDRHTQGLSRVEIEQVGPLFFASAAPRGEKPSSRWAGLWERLEATQWRSLKLAKVVRYSLGCNWKVFVDNYLDGGYHVSAVHPGLAGQLDLDSYRTEVFEDYSIQSCGGVAGRIGGEAMYAFLYPNFMINRYGEAMDVNLVLPRGADRCEVVFAFYFTPQVLADAEKVAAAIASSDEVQREDVWICESVQKGLASGGYIPGRYSVIRQGGERAFHVRLARELAR